MTRWIKNTMLVLLMLSVAGCAGGAQTEEGVSDATGFQPIPEDATVEALNAQRTASGDAAKEENADGLYAAEQAQDTEQEEDTAASDQQSAAFTMAFAGDVLLQSYTMSAYDQSGWSGLISDSLQELLFDADLAMVNEEFPFGTGGTAADKEYTFIADPAYVSFLTDLGVDLVSLANNHVLDYGQEVLSQTFTILDDAGIGYVGAGQTPERAGAWLSFDLNGTMVGILAASRVIPDWSWNVDSSQPGVFSTYDSTRLVQQIRAAKQENDLVVVYVHWGIENAETPEEYQRQLAREYIDAGADLVIGSHPHVLQGIEFYQGVPIFYSLGNFIFNYTIDRTVLLLVRMEETGEFALQIIPAAASGARTDELDGEAAAALLEYMESISYGVTVDENGVVSSSS